MRAPTPPNESERLRALRSYAVLDTGAEAEFDDIARLAASICGAPIAAISFVESERQWFKASHGIAHSEIPRDSGFSAYAILDPHGALEVHDVTVDERFSDLPWVACENGLRFLIAVPLVTPDGFAIGALCVGDRVTRDIADWQREGLAVLAKQVVTALELRRSVAALRDQGEVLLRAEAAAEAGNRTKASFLSNMSHEIRTPMNGILGVAGLLTTTPLNESQRHYVSTIQNSAESLLTLLMDVLDLAKIEEGRLEVRHELIDLITIVDEITSLTQPTASLKGIDLRIPRMTDHSMRPVGDPLRLKQVLLQLMDEAIRFTDLGWVELAISFGEGKMTFEVSDTRAQTRHRDAGLGPAVSAGIVKLMGGEIATEVDAAGGVVRHFSLAAVRAPTVLVVDDNSVNSMVLAAILERHGCRVHCAVGGREAVEAAATQRYDIVFMDLIMPEMDGLEAAKAIRSLSSDTANAPILAITSSPYDGARDECLQAGMNDYLNKPVREPMIVEALTKWDRRSVK